MNKLLRTVLVLGGLGYLGWRWWQANNADSASAWAAETDRIG